MTSRSLIIRALVALGLAAVASVPAAIAAPFAPDHGPARVLEERSCATPAPGSLEMGAARSAMRRYVEDGGAKVTGQISIAWHVIHDGPVGDVPQSQIEDQIAYLNAAYAGTGFSFVLASVDRTDSKAWFAMIPGTGKEKQAKKNLAIDPLHYFNVYSAAPGKNLLGWATFPWMFDEGDYEHGVVLHYGSLPGGYLVPYNLGGTLAHEAGHYLGLLHTFQGGCVAPGDYCDDTPFEASPASRCPEGRDTCTEPGLDPIHNYMDYSDDACYTEFTPDQIAMMQSLTGAYRPHLFGGPVAQSRQEPAGAAMTTGGVALRNAFPNPFRESTTLRLVLPGAAQASVGVYDVAGQRVATLADGLLEAGEHSLVFAPRGLAPGTYFVLARVDGRAVAHTVVLVK